MTSLDEGATALILEGRKFKADPRSISFDQEMYITSIVARSGMRNLTAKGHGIENEDAALQFVAAAYEAGVLFDLLAGSFTPEGEKWSPALAKDTAQFFRDLTDPSAKEELRKVMVMVVLGFFLSGTEDGLTSRRSSSRLPVGKVRKSVPGPYSGTEGHSTSESGEKSSELSPDSSPAGTETS